MPTKTNCEKITGGVLSTLLKMTKLSLSKYLATTLKKF